jgi:hypothetical protein
VAKKAAWMEARAAKSKPKAKANAKATHTTGTCQRRVRTRQRRRQRRMLTLEVSLRPAAPVQRSAWLVAMARLWAAPCVATQAENVGQLDSCSFIVKNGCSQMRGKCCKM